MKGQNRRKHASSLNYLRRAENDSEKSFFVEGFSFFQILLEKWESSLREIQQICRWLCMRTKELIPYHNYMDSVLFQYSSHTSSKNNNHLYVHFSHSKPSHLHTKGGAAYSRLKDLVTYLPS